MELTGRFEDTVRKRARDDAAFRVALVEEAAQQMLEGDTATAAALLRDVVMATIGLDGLAEATGLSKASLARMLGPHGNPRADNLARILRAVGMLSGVTIVVHAEPVAA